MISYNPKDWLGLFRFHKADTARKLFPLMLCIAFYTFLISYLERTYLHLEEKGIVENIPLMHNLLGFAISMLLVFRTNTAYDRWWEGRKNWGSLVNNSRNLAIKMHTMLPPDDVHSRSFFARLIPQFASELQAHLQKETTRLQLDVQPHPEIPNFDTTKHVPAQVMSLMMAKVNQLYKSGHLTGDQLIVINQELQSFMDICGACERIKNTPIPFSYSSFIKKFIFFYVVTLPFGFAFKLGYLNIAVVVFVFYVMASLELIAEEIEDPFGDDPNDLPLKKMAENIRKNVTDIFSTH